MTHHYHHVDIATRDCMKFPVDRSMIDTAVKSAVTAKFADMTARVDAFAARRQAARDAMPPGRGYVRDADGKVRPRTTKDLAVVAGTYWQDRGSPKAAPGQPGYAFEPPVPHATTTADLQRNADAYWAKQP